MSSLDEVAAEVAACTRCPRLVAWRTEIGETKRAMYRDDIYWARGVPGFGDRGARLVIMGLAPAAHGANRTGRMFTGDRSGDWLYRALYRAGFANQPESVDRNDGLELSDAWVTSPVKCAPPQNKPTAKEQANCRSFLTEELSSLPWQVTVALGKIGFDAMARQLELSPRPTFGHGVEVSVGEGRTLMGCYHVSQQNTFTGRLTEEMLDAVMSRARELLT